MWGSMLILFSLVKFNIHQRAIVLYHSIIIVQWSRNQGTRGATGPHNISTEGVWPPPPIIRAQYTSYQFDHKIVAAKFSTKTVK